MHEQWLLKYDSLGKLLEGIRKEEIHPEHLSMLESITSDYESLGDLFSQLQANFAKRKRLIEENRPQAEINLSLALEERLTAQALMRSQKITSEAFGLSATVQQRIARVQQRTNSIVLFSIIGFAIVSFSISFLTTRAITGPLGELVRSAEIIGKGNLKHRVDIKTKNEIGELAAAFGQMTERRQRAEESLKEYSERLEEVVEERTAELNERVAEVEQLNRGMVNLTEDLQVTNRDLEATAARLQEVNQELNDFAYVVSHDLKAPLRAISQLANWISADYADALDQEGQEMLHLLTGRTKRMHDLIEGILQYSRIGRVTEKESIVDLNQLAQETIEMLALPEHIQITVKDELPTVTGERTRLGQVFQNLFDNAVKFMDKPEGRVSLYCVDEGTHWLFSVADNGPGIEEKHHTRAFQIFQTLAPRDQVESTGVGLALVKKIVEAWGGSIWVESTVGEGSTFYFTLPKKGKKNEKA